MIKGSRKAAERLQGGVVISGLSLSSSFSDKGSRAGRGRFGRYFGRSEVVAETSADDVAVVAPNSSDDGPY